MMFFNGTFAFSQQESRKIGTIVVYQIPTSIKDINVYSNETKIDEEVFVPVFEDSVSEVYTRIEVKDAKDVNGWEFTWYLPNGTRIPSTMEKDTSDTSPHVITSVDLNALSKDMLDGLWVIKCVHNGEDTYQAYFMIGDYSDLLPKTLKKQFKLSGEIKELASHHGDIILYKNRLYSYLPELLEESLGGYIKTIDELQFQGIGNSDSRIAVLVYNANNISMNYKTINRKGIAISELPEKGNVPTTYGYVYRYDATNKKIEVNKLSNMEDVWSVKEYSNHNVEKWGENNIFWKVDWGQVSTFDKTNLPLL